MGRLPTTQASETGGAAGQTLKLSTATYEKAKKAAPSLDIYYLETEWRTLGGQAENTDRKP